MERRSGRFLDWIERAAIFVPMLMTAGISPEATQPAYRIGDSPTNILTPLNDQFPLVPACDALAQQPMNLRAFTTAAGDHSGLLTQPAAASRFLVCVKKRNPGLAETLMLYKRSEWAVHSGEFVIVGVPLQVADAKDWARRRTPDLTPTPDTSFEEHFTKQLNAPVRSGGAALFLRALKEELIPFIEESTHRTDTAVPSPEAARGRSRQQPRTPGRGRGLAGWHGY
jgi:hypothetical protein